LQVEGLLFAGEDLLFTPARPEERPPPEPPVEPVDPPEPPEPPVDPPTPVVRPVPYISGEDLALLFLDVDGNISTGFNQMDIGIGADYLVAVRGREGVVKNATLMSFNPSDLDEPWAILGEVEVGKDDRRMETQIPSSILVPGIHPLVQVRLIAWNESRDGTDFPITSPYLPTRSNEETYGARSATRSGGVETKNLYLRTGNQLSTFVGGALATTQISAGSSVTWTQTPAMSGDFNITGTVSTILHLTPANAGNNRPSATVTLGYGATTLGSSTISPIPSTGWYTFNIPATATIPAGNTIWARIAVTGANQNVRATVSYNSQTYNSRIDIPTDTYINVEWVRTYNEGVETNNFQPEETVEIRANITDPLGIQDISSVTATVYYPNGTILASNLAMAIYQSDPGNFWRTYNATAPLPSDAPGGVYLVEITATETNGVLSHGEHRFFSPVERGVMLYPDSTLEGSAGGSVTFSLSLQNIGVEAEDILLFPGSSSMGWRSELVAGGSVVAYDSDGDGVWDWIDGAYSSGGAVLLSLDSQEVVLVSLRKLIPSGVSGVVDVTSIRAQMSGNSSIFDDATLTTMVPAPGVLKSLYLRGGSALSTIPGAATATTAIANGGSASWVQSPILAGNFAITGTVSVVLYISTTTHGINQASVTASLRYDGVLLGSHTIAGMTTAGWYTFPISATGTLAGGEALSLEVSTAIRPITVYYNSPEYPSRIDIPTNTYTRVQWTKAYNVSAETNSFVAGEQVEIRANVTDPLGQQDIDYAQITITYPDGTPLTTNTIMSTLQTDPANYWRLFNHIFTMPADAPVGTYNYTVTAYETDGANHNLTRSFVVPCGVSVGPDLNITGYENTTLNYTQWINNTGKGADVYNLFVNSVRGWNVSIWSGGVLMAYDSNGDGAWEYVNPAFDTSGDGNPDTGLLLPGDGIQVHVSLQIPLGVEGSDAVALTAVSIGGVCSDTATAIIQVVEIPFSSQEWFIIIALPLFMAYNRVSKGRNRSKLKKTDVANGPDPESIH
ncbi:MAG: hypothetical protein QCI38_04295, partial [Candidatus Thermoplasmatota archaeon]|nr:hypothetical protein [Candidatus Thermoplasmatota archaeon]